MMKNMIIGVILCIIGGCIGGCINSYRVSELQWKYDIEPSGNSRPIYKIFTIIKKKHGLDIWWEGGLRVSRETGIMQKERGNVGDAGSYWSGINSVEEYLKHIDAYNEYLIELEKFQIEEKLELQKALEELVH